MNSKWRNPNKDFDALIWKPKSRFLRRLMARYVDYVEILGYIFAAVLVGSIIATWVIPKREWVDADGRPQLVPVTVSVTAPGACSVSQSSINGPTEVVEGQVLAVVVLDASGDTVALTAKGNGVAYPPFVMRDYGRYTKAEIDSLAKVTDLPPAKRALVDSLLRQEFSAILPGQHLDSGETVVQIVDFGKYRVTAKFNRGLDSITVGDSVEFIATGSSLKDKGTRALGIVNIRTGRDIATARLTSVFADPLVERVKNSVKGVTVTAREQGIYTVESAEGIEVTLRADGVALSEEGECPLRGFNLPFYGVLDSGTTWMNAEALLVKLGPEARQSVKGWADSVLANRCVAIDGVNFKAGDSVDVRMKVTLKSKSDLKDFVPFDKKRPKTVPEYLERGRWIDGVVVVSDPPIAVKRAARELFEQSPPRYLVAEVRLNSHNTTWGKKLIQK